MKQIRFAMALIVLTVVAAWLAAGELPRASLSRQEISDEAARKGEHSPVDGVGRESELLRRRLSASLSEKLRARESTTAPAVRVLDNAPVAALPAAEGAESADAASPNPRFDRAQLTASEQELVGVYDALAEALNRTSTSCSAMEDAVEQLISRNQDLLLRHASASVSASDRERVDRAAEPVLRDMRAGLRNGIARCGAQDDRLLRAVRRLAGAAGDEIQG